jgi:hypothetical protein
MSSTAFSDLLSLFSTPWGRSCIVMSRDEDYGGFDMLPAVMIWIYSSDSFYKQIR